MVPRCLLVLLVSSLFCPPIAHAAQTVRPELVRSLPHDTAAFTQGLLLYKGVFYESTGLRGMSTLRRVDPLSGDVLSSIDLAPGEFGEGLARVSDRLVQLTWQEHVAHVYDRDSFEELRSFSYSGEGWGLCYDGQRLVMSDGSDQLSFRDAGTFELIGAVSVEDSGEPVFDLNELECVGSVVYANVWQTDRIVRIDPETGQVLHVIDASGLLSPEESAGADVLNGIAYDADSQHFFVTGKLWPKLFEVRLPVDDAAAAPEKSAHDEGGGCAIRGPVPERSPFDPLGRWLGLFLMVQWRRRMRRVRYAWRG